MKGWLIYDEESAIRNKFFADEIIKNFRNRNIDIQLKTNTDFLGSVDFACVRTINPSINRELEQRGVRVFNNYITSKIANDKYETYLTCKALNIPVAHTELLENSDLAFPFVLKSVDGHGGSEVFLVNDKTELDGCLSSRNKRYIVQQVCYPYGVDVRVYVLGEKILGATLRVGSSFKSNFSLGGVAERYEPTPFMVDVAKTIQRELKSDFIGVDFIRRENDWVLNEIEDVVGSRTLYSAYNYDVAKIYVDYVIDILCKN